MKTEIILLITLIFLFPTLQSFGVSSPYWDSAPANPLIMQPGETKTINFNLQNMVGEEDVSVQGRLVEGTSIAELKQTNFEVKKTTSDTMAPLELRISETAEIGTIYKVKLEFNTLSYGEAGMVSLGTGMDVSFDVVIGEKIEVKTSPKMPWKPLGIIFGILVLITIIIIIFMLKRKNSQESLKLTSSTELNKF